MRELITVETDPNRILRKVCKPVGDINPEVLSIAEDLTNNLLDSRGAKVVPVSVSAPQLGESIQMFAYYRNPEFKERQGIEILINPTIVELGELRPMVESCLSIPGRTFLVERARLAKVKGIDLNSQPRTIKARDILAQLLQHEIDHLNGVLIFTKGKLVP